MSSKDGTWTEPQWGRLYPGSWPERYSSYPSAGLTPGKLAAILRAADQGELREQMELYEEMEEKDAHLAAILQTRKIAVQGLAYRLVPAAETVQDRKIADFVRGVLERLDFDQIIMNILDALGKGFSVNEIVWGVRDNHVVVEAVEWIDPKRVSFSRGEQPELIMADGYTLMTPPPWKIIFHRCIARSGSVVRAGLLRTVAWVYLFKNYALKDWNVFNEVFGMPLRLGKFEPTATPEDREILSRAIQALGSDAAAIISKNTEIEFIEAPGRGGGRENPYMAMAEFCNREMSKAILGQTLTTDVYRGTGTYSAARVHHEVRRDIVQSDADSLAATLQGQLLRPLVGFNFGWDRRPPTLQFYAEGEVNLREMAETYEKLLAMGVPIPPEHLAEVFHLPRVEVTGQKP
ncbi:MAG: phage portal protein family protein [Desulfobacca sp.]|uniref:phage portal protein family protein n=1 Tax=Desulfobacca sp. TaxID=2067990 RepID=UPI00404A9E5A